MTLSALPIWAVDMIGSISMIGLSILCLRIALKLRSRDRNNIIWTYLFWVCTALTLFAVSRSAGHILKQILIISGDTATWRLIQPFSGAINTFTFAVVGSFTLFFQQSWKIYGQILKDKDDLQKVSDELLYVNQNLENLVAERTQELALSEQQYRRIFEISRDMILVTRIDGGMVDINPAGCRMIGLNSHDCLKNGRHFQEFFADETDWQTVIKNIRTDGFVTNIEIQLQHEDHRQIRTLLSGTLDPSETDKDNTVHFLVKDIEQKRLVEEQIAQADKLASIGQLSAGIAHEINNPLGIILGYTQLLIRNAKPVSERYNDLKTIEKHVRSCKTIVEDLLNFARTSKPREDLIRVDDVLDDVLKFVQQHADLDQISIGRSYDPAAPDMLLDEEKIKQVFINLVMNAKHAMGDSGQLTVSTEYRETAHQVVIKLTDTGHGINRKDLPRIFDPFFTTKPTGEGTGLGLSVSYGIIKNHGGDIKVDSEGGRGATFTIVLPVVAPEKGNQHGKINPDRR